MKTQRLLFVCLFSFLLLGGLFAVLRVSAASSATATTIVVDTLDDELNDDEDCSLREAITAANDNVAVDTCGSGELVTDTITFSVSGTITLGEQLTVTAGGPLEINGEEVITLSGNLSVRVFTNTLGSELTLHNLTLIHGEAVDDGGGIYNNGTLSIINSTLSDNRVNGIVVNGGGIYNTGTLILTKSILRNNSAIGDFMGLGGGIYNSFGTLTVTESTLTGNYAMISGGIHNYYGTVEITKSTLNGNTADTVGGGISNDGTTTIKHCTVLNNNASHGGGIDNDGTLKIINSTLSGNHATQIGGGVNNSFVGTVTVTNSTLVDNDAYLGAGVYNETSGQTTLYNTIVAGNLTGNNCQGTITDGGHNIEDTDTCNFDLSNGSFPNTDPLLGALGDNGGPTLTHALLYGSPAIDAADPVQCPDFDQRGVPRPLDGDGDWIAICDIGSFEYQLDASNTAITNDDPDPSQASQPFMVTFTVTSTFGTPSGAVTVTVDGETETCTGTLGDGMGYCNLTLQEPGIYTLTATYAGNESYLPSSDIEPHTVVKAETTTTISVDEPDPSLPGQPFMVTFAVTSFITPSGSVTVTVDSETESCTSALEDGMGSCSMALNAPGTYTLTATYPGDDLFLPSSDTEEHKVKPFDVFLPVILVSPPPVQIMNIHYRVERDGCTLAGDVYNPSSQTVYEVELSGSYNGGDGIHYFYAHPAFEATLPGMQNPFSAYISSAYDCPPAFIQVAAWKLQSPFRFESVAILSRHIGTSGCFLLPPDICLPTEATLSGEIKNTHAVPLTEIKVITKPGSQAYYGTADLERTTLAAGEVTTYTMYIYDPFGISDNLEDYQALGIGKVGD